MIIEYDIFCFNRTLRITFPDNTSVSKNTILKCLDTYYDSWHSTEDAQCTPLEEYMMICLSIICNDWISWESIDN